MFLWLLLILQQPKPRLCINSAIYCHLLVIKCHLILVCLMFPPLEVNHPISVWLYRNSKQQAAVISGYSMLKQIACYSIPIVLMAQRNEHICRTEFCHQWIVSVVSFAASSQGKICRLNLRICDILSPPWQLRVCSQVTGIKCLLKLMRYIVGIMSEFQTILWLVNRCLVARAPSINSAH